MKTEVKAFESIHIDLKKDIFELNEEKMNRIKELKLEWSPEEGWALEISKDDVYIAPMGISTEKI